MVAADVAGSAEPVAEPAWLVDRAGLEHLRPPFGHGDRRVPAEALRRQPPLVGLLRLPLADLRARNIGFVFQTFNLLPVLTAEENVEYPLLQLEEVSRKDRRERVALWLERVGLAKFARHRPNQLSGGQRQRVAVARALVAEPDIVLADEPTANLDHNTGEGILELMKDINRRYKTTFIFSTHDKKVMSKADRLVWLEDGQVRMLGVRTPEKWVVVDERRRARPAQATAAQQ